ncbi:MAG: hypothetical protein J6I62_10875 [Selenomonadaceae bacterium]|nr:hypothetical protein [Selenomonadaceae bacterium]
MTEKEIENLLDIYETIDKDDIPRREVFWGVLKALGKASLFMEVLTKDEE